ncbi:MAG TPA: glycosyltransferase [Candidatus Baltobacteraceae bacterium]|nr:glycosyltransferase [Candidatus Baltobacteraceae bacterium]
MFLSANVGVGHTSAAHALKTALADSDPNFEATVVDSYKYAASVVSSVVSSGYLGMVKTIPQMYRFLYNRAERATEVGPFRAWVHQFTAGNLRALLSRLRPDVVICTHAFPCGVMAEYKRQFADAPPVMGVVTDFVVHSFWIHQNIDAYAVATEQMRSTLVTRGIPSERILVSGIPVHSSFGHPRADMESLRQELGLPLDRRIALLMGGGLGLGPIEMMMQALDRMSVPVCAVAIVGRSSRVEQRVLERAHRVHYPVRVVRFVHNVQDYMHASDVLITKPGGLTSSEALAAGLPMVLFKPLPGQEERNTRYLVQRHAALRAKSSRDLTRTVERLLSSDDRRKEMRAAMAALGKPDAATEIAEVIRTLCRTANRRAIA